MGNYYPGSKGAAARGTIGNVLDLSPLEYRERPRPRARRPLPRVQPLQSRQQPFSPKSVGASPLRVAELLSRRALWRRLSILEDVIYILNPAVAGQPELNTFNVPAGWSGAGSFQTWCESTKNFPPTSDPNKHTGYGNAGPAGGTWCIGGQAVGVGSVLHWGFWTSRGQSANRYAHIRSFHRPSNSSADIPTVVYSPAVDPVPATYTIADFPLWWRQSLAEMPLRVHRSATIKALRPWIPGEVGPAPVPRPEPEAPPVRPRPPGKGTKERKFVLAIGQRSLVGLGVNLVTESLDVLNCLNDSLPRKYRPTPHVDGKGKWHRATPQQIAYNLYLHHDKIDPVALLQCMIANQVEDYAIGKLGQLTAKANRRRGRMHGFALGPAL